MGILEQWKLTPEELSEILIANPSLRGITFGYVGEYKLRKLWFSDGRVSDLIKYDDHTRTLKGDLTFTYCGVRISVEVKSLQSNSVRDNAGEATGRFQCDASDRRRVVLPNGDSVETTCLLVGEFDLLAVNLFQFHGEWVFAFAKNKDLPRSAYRKYTPEQRSYLLASTAPISWPLRPPFEAEPFRLLDEIVSEKVSAQTPDPGTPAIFVERVGNG